MPSLRSKSRNKRSASPPRVAPRLPTSSPGSNSKRKSSRSPREIVAHSAHGAVTAFPLDPVTPAGLREHALRFGSTHESVSRRMVVFTEEEEERDAEEAEDNVGESLKRVRRGGGGRRGKEAEHSVGGILQRGPRGRGSGRRGREAVASDDTAKGEYEKAVAETGKRKFEEVASSESEEEEENPMADELASTENGKRRFVEISSESDEERNPTPPVDNSREFDEGGSGRNGSSLLDAGGATSSRGFLDAGEATSSRATRVSEQYKGPHQRNPIEPNRRPGVTKAKFLEIATRRAAHFAHFADEPLPAAAVNENPDLERVVDEQKRRAAELLAEASAGAGRPENDDGENQWPGPFVIARELVEGREAAAAARRESSRGAEPQRKSSVEWVPSRQPDFKKTRYASSLHDMCVEVLCANIEHVQSLFGMTDSAKRVIAASLCANRSITADAVRLYFSSEPAEIVLPDCTSVTEEILTESLAKCDTRKLEHLELGLCGRAMSDQLCASALAGHSCSLPLLHTLRLKGAYRLTDTGLKALVEVTPNLKTLNLKECSKISAAGLEAVANSVGRTLNSLSVESCSQLNALRILPPILKMSNLESLCLSGLGEMSDGIISELAVILGPRLQELSIAHCKALTDVAVRAISLCCGGLKLLDIGYLPLLTDAAIGSLADGCRSLRTLRLDRGKFSDTTLAALITASGNCLTELSLDSVRQTGDLTVSALAKYSKATLQELDLSFCREVSDEALGLLADNCSALHEIRLFGCTQVTNVFVEGHSNPVLNLIGLMNCVLDVSFSAQLAKERSKTQFRG